LGRTRSLNSRKVRLEPGPDAFLQLRYRIASVIF
jgi:hypothetical protein